jgi:tRNA U34 5-methylaminomethyl-2-thiouridine-forming methyltransferase MnmC
MKDIILNTHDGSHTVQSTKYGVTYHSIHGAITESTVVFIEAGLKYVLDQNKEEITIFEMGLGTGLNALLTLAYTKSLKIKVNYVALEAFPIEEEIVKKLNYDQLIKNSSKKELTMIHNEVWGESIVLSENFTFRKMKTTLQDYNNDDCFDLIYFDAFAPTCQPELWTSEAMLKMNKILKENGVFCTYCAKGEFKRTIKECGFEVQALAGPPGKREITRAIKKQEYP